MVIDQVTDEVPGRNDLTERRRVDGSTFLTANRETRSCRRLIFSGLATGLDTGSIVSQLVEIKRAPVYRLQKDKKAYEDQITALSTLKTKLLALQTAARKLDTAGEFCFRQGHQQRTDALTVTAGGSARTGPATTIKVQSLATAQKDQSQGFDSKLDNVGTGTVSFTVGGETTELTLTGVTSLEGLATLINDNVEGVSRLDRQLRRRHRRLPPGRQRHRSRHGRRLHARPQRPVRRRQPRS